MNILALDTSTEACSVACRRSDGEVFAEFDIAPRQHTRLLPLMMDSVLVAAGVDRSALDYCAFCNGPGAFTGVRIAAATAQGIGIGLAIPLVTVSTLATLAQVSLDRQQADNTLVALDARMGDVYWAVYRRNSDNLAELTGSERIDRIDEVSVKTVIDHGAGHGWRAAGEAWQIDGSVVVDADLLPDANALLKLANQKIAARQMVSAESITINYLRNKVAEKSSKV